RCLRCPPDRHSERKGWCTLVPAGQHPPARHRDHSRPGRNCDPDRASLRPAGNAALRYRGHGARFVRSLQHQRRSRCSRRGHAEGAGGVRLMPDLRELYQEVILEHSKAPRNYRELATANHRAEGYNPLCGDHFTVYLDLEGDSIRDISFQGSGCAISKASASLMTQSVKGKTGAEAARLFDQFRKLVTGQSPANGNRAELGKLAVFSGVSEFPVRVKCATLAWHTLHASLEGKQGIVSTE